MQIPKPRTLAALAGSEAFTLAELLVVIAIIAVLASLVLGTAGYVHKKGASSRAQTELSAISVGCENYKIDQGTYPSDLGPGKSGKTQKVDARKDWDPTTGKYKQSGEYFYTAISGDTDGNPSNGIETTIYVPLRPAMLSANGAGKKTLIIDPFGNSYGYSTIYQDDPSCGYNPTYDLWSTNGGKTSADAPRWIKNW